MKFQSILKTLVILFIVQLLVVCAVSVAQTAVDSEVPTEGGVPLPFMVAVFFQTLTPVIIQFVKKKVANKNLRFAAAVVVSAAIGMISSLIAGYGFSLLPMSGFMVAAFGFGQTAHNVLKLMYKDNKGKGEPTITKTATPTTAPPVRNARGTG